MVNGISTVTDAASGAAAMKKATGMNKDDFLKLFIAQLQNQDPLKPQDGAEFIGQLAQLSQVEQAFNTNTNLQNLATAQQNVATMNAVSFIGKEVLATGSQVVLGANSQPTLNYRMPLAAEQLSLEIRDALGTVVRTLTQGKTPAGNGALAWDGRDGKNLPLPPGLYSFSVTGTDGTGNKFSGTSLMQGRVDSLKLDGTSPVLTVGGIDVPLASVLRVQGG